MRLRSTRSQVVRIAAIDLTIDFVEGEEIRTEISRKFTREVFTAAIEEAGLELKDWYTDENERFALALATPDA
jgi:L-histidine N-alpha-methyltransferase